MLEGTLKSLHLDPVYGRNLAKITDPNGNGDGGDEVNAETSAGKRKKRATPAKKTNKKRKTTESKQNVTVKPGKVCPQSVFWVILYS